MKKRSFLYIDDLTPCFVTKIHYLKFSSKIMTKPSYEITERILRVLEDAQVSDITQVAKMAGTTRITAKKHLERLVGEKKLREYRLGRARIFLIWGGEKK